DGDGIVGELPRLTHFGNSPGSTFFCWQSNLDDATHTGPACSGGTGIDLVDVRLRQVVLTRGRRGFIVTAVMMVRVFVMCASCCGLGGGSDAGFRGGLHPIQLREQIS